MDWIEGQPIIQTVNSIPQKRHFGGYLAPFSSIFSRKSASFERPRY
jgi:hypothetical protein